MPPTLHCGVRTSESSLLATPVVCKLVWAVLYSTPNSATIMAYSLAQTLTLLVIGVIMGVLVMDLSFDVRVARAIDYDILGADPGAVADHSAFQTVSCPRLRGL